MDNRTEQIADGVWRVEVGPLTNAYVVARDGHRDADGLVLVDAASWAGAPRLVRSIRLLGLDPSTIDEILLTHWHADHAGGAIRFLSSSAAPRLRARPPEDAVLGHRTAPPIGRRTVLSSGLLGRRRIPGPAEVTPLVDDERLAGRLEAVATPGHTAGHTAYWLPHERLLLAGDALLHIGPLSAGARMATDLDAVPETLDRLATLGPSVLACGHGPPLRRDTSARLTRLAERWLRRGRPRAR